MRRRLVLLAVLVLAIVGGVYVSADAGRSGPGASTALRSPAAPGTGARNANATTAAAVVPPPPHLLVTAPAHTATGWSVVAQVRGHPAVWLKQRGGTTLMRFEQGLVHLTLHAGSSDGGTTGWRYGDRITPREIHLLVAAFNGGFKLTYPGTGFTSGGHVASPLHAGLASIVTYTDGTTAIGTWHAGVPSSRKTVYSVLQNQHLLVDQGQIASTATTCILTCFGATVGSQTVVARSALGINQAGQLIWAAGNQLTPAGLGQALVSAGAVRAVELDINPDWVAAYLYPHHPSGPSAVPVIPGQRGIAGQLLEPYSRDFFAVVAN